MIPQISHAVSVICLICYPTAEGGHAMRHLLAAALAVMLALSAAP